MVFFVMPIPSNEKQWFFFSALFVSDHTQVSRVFWSSDSMHHSWIQVCVGDISYRRWCNQRYSTFTPSGIDLHSDNHFITNAVVTPLRKIASYEPRIAILWIWGNKWLTCGKYGIYVAVRGSYGALTGSTWRLLPRKINPIYCRVSYVAVTRIPSLVLHNTWHYVIIRYSYGELLNLSYVAHTRRLYAKVWPQH